MAETAKAGVAAGHRLTAEAAVSVLKAGGSAVDAAIAGLWMACVAEPVLASPGGGGFMMIGGGGAPTLLDFFVETPPKRAPGPTDARRITADFGTATQDFTIGAGTTAIPGFVPGLFAAHDRHGRLPMTDLVVPAVEAARTGVTVTRYQAYLMQVVSPILLADPAAAGLYGDGRATWGPGTRFSNPDLADTLTQIARSGAAAIGDRLVAANSDGGVLTAAALAAYRPVWRDPLVVERAGARIALNPPPSAGGALVAAMLDALATTGTVDAAMAAVDRRWIENGRDLARFLNRETPATLLAPRGTTHISVVDPDGLAVAATVSNGEGNGILIPGAGFMANNMLGEDDVNPAGPDAFVPGVRLSSMMAPTLVTTADGAQIVLGSGGSNRIRTAIFQVVARLIDGAAVTDAIEAPRLHVEAGHLDFEDQIEAGVRARLIADFPDHRPWPDHNMFFGGVHAVAHTADGTVTGHGDPRRAGVFVPVY